MKKIASILFFFIRILTLNYKFARKKNTLIIFVFHKVSDLKTTFHSPLPVETYEKLVLFLKKYYNIIHVKDISSYFFENKNDKPAAIITFDDGLADIKEFVLPIMEKYNVKFNINIDTEILETKKPQDFLKIYDILNESQPDYYFDEDYMKDKIQIKDSSPFNVEDQFTQVLSGLSLIDRRKFIDKFVNSLNYKGNYYGVLSVSDIKLLSENKLVEFGSHSHTHTVLTQLEKKELVFELLHSKMKIQKAVNQNIDIIAYPNGQFNEQVDLTSLNVGYKYLLKSENKINVINSYLPTSYYRINQYHESFEISIAYTYGLLSFIKKIYGRLFNS